MWVEIVSLRKKKSSTYYDSENPKRKRTEITIHNKHKFVGGVWVPTTNEWVEDTTQRGRKFKVYKNDSWDNKEKLVAAIHDQHYKDNNGHWQDVDERLENDGQDGYDKKCNKTAHEFRIASAGKRSWAPDRNNPNERVEVGDIEYYTNKWNKLNLPAAVWKNQGAEWDMAYLKATITNTWRRVKTDFVMKNSSCPTRLRFAITLVGLTMTDWTLYSIATGLPVGSIDPISAVDANEEVVPTTSTYSGGYVEWQVDPTGKTYPIAVDPSFTDGFGGDVQTYKDTRIISVVPDSNYGTGDTMSVGDNSGSDDRASRNLVQFDYSSIPATATIVSVTNSLYESAAGVSGGPASWAVRWRRLLVPWIESEATWNNRATGTAWTTAGAGSDGDDRDADVSATVTLDDTAASAYIDWTDSTLTDDIQKIVDGTYTNYGWLIEAPTAELLGEAAFAFNTFNTSDHASTDTRPKSVVIYNRYTDTSTAYDCAPNSDTPTQTSGTAWTFQTAWGNKCGLIKFDVSSLAGKTVLSSSMALTNQNAQIEAASNYHVCRILAANSGWTEAGATWAHAVEDTVEWAGSAGASTADTDYNSTPIGEFTLANPTAADTTTVFSLDTDQVQDMIDSGNYGFRVFFPAEEYYGVLFYTSDEEDEPYRPYMTVDYEEPTGRAYSLPAMCV